MRQVWLYTFLNIFPWLILWIFLNKGGCGGGIIYFNITKEVKIDGVTSSSGQDGANTGYAGGGTGGSILIETALFDGSGSIEVCSLEIQAPCSFYIDIKNFSYDNRIERTTNVYFQ